MKLRHTCLNLVWNKLPLKRSQLFKFYDHIKCERASCRLRVHVDMSNWPGSIREPNRIGLIGPVSSRFPQGSFQSYVENLETSLDWFGSQFYTRNLWFYLRTHLKSLKYLLLSFLVLGLMFCFLFFFCYWKYHSSQI